MPKLLNLALTEVRDIDWTPKTTMPMLKKRVALMLAALRERSAARGLMVWPNNFSLAFSVAGLHGRTRRQAFVRLGEPEIQLPYGLELRTVSEHAELGSLRRPSSRLGASRTGLARRNADPDESRAAVKDPERRKGTRAQVMGLQTYGVSSGSRERTDHPANRARLLTGAQWWIVGFTAVHERLRKEGYVGDFVRRFLHGSAIRADLNRLCKQARREQSAED
jgi:hypothetical protein